MSLPPVLFLEPLTCCHNFTCFGDAHTFCSPSSKMSHPGGNIKDGFTSHHSFIMDEAGFRISLFTIKGYHVTSLAQVHSCATWVSMIKSINCKIDTIRILIRGSIHTHSDFNFHPQLQGIPPWPGSWTG